MKNFTLVVATLLAALPVFLRAQCPTDAGPDHTICYNYGSQSVQIGPASADPSYIYRWTPTTGLSSSTVPNPYSSVNTTTTYTLTVHGPGCNVVYTATVYIAGHITVTAPAGNIVPALYTIDLWFPGGSSNSVALHSTIPTSTSWYVYPSTLVGTGTDYTYSVPASSSADPTFYVVTTDDQNNTCSYTDLTTIQTYPCYSSSDYAVPVSNTYYPSGCGLGPHLPATITQSTTMGAGTSYYWTLQATSGSWSISSPSGNQATLGGSGSSTSVYTRASNPSYLSGTEYWMLWNVINKSTCTLSIGAEPAGANGNQFSDSASAGTMLYPNPASDHVTVSAVNPIKEIDVNTISGSVVKKIVTGSVLNYTLSTGDLAAGVYICKLLLANGQEKTIRFVVRK